ncbi:Pkinase-domain-containing protein [Wolfiporia cocos MD-104 SS10]|uniref:non-specific serine/threonine protein kinase n=1 Tax=Wolfiporia cocos (strain MD-104) TaxID=742152 RepID=A0A2H3JPU3_WOLCO|nr:Pkinase-domain-containing protein [Wolfiporia cocos MD-104 SS10]
MSQFRGKKGDDPKMIGLWKVGRTIGKGSSGRVRIARHTKTGQYAAVKIVSKNALLNSRMSIRSFGDEAERILHSIEREIVIMKLIEHPNIMRLYDVWETSSELYLILEYVEGGELFDYLCSKGRLSSTEALGYFQQIITAVHYCHRFNIAHRDLKPENLLMDRDKNIKVADFGMAAWQGKSDLLQTACGSPHYAAPEVIMGCTYNGSYSDIWSCGVILYALLAGRLPFDDEDLPTLLEKVKVGKFSMPSDIDTRAKDLIRRMLEKDVSKRITIPEILKHPFYTSQKLKAMSCDIPNLDDIARPLPDASAIDPDIFANLRTLWHGIPDEEIITSLTNDKHTWEKGVYHLLVRYRAKHLENYDEEEEKLASKRASKRRTKKEPTPEERHDELLASLPSRAGPPTPRRATARDSDSTANISPSPTPGLSQMRQLSMLSSSLSIANQATPSPSPLNVRPHPASLATSPLMMHGSLSPTTPRTPAGPLTLEVPQMQDERIQTFFNQIVEHLNVMQAAGSPHQRHANLDTTQSPGMTAVPPSTPLPITPKTPHTADARGAHVKREGPPQSTDTFGTDMSLQSNNTTRPLTIRPRSPQRAYAKADKENTPRGPRLTVHTDLPREDTGAPFRTSSTRSSTGARRVQIVEPPTAERARLRKKRRGLSPASPASALSEASSFSLPSPPRRRWLGQLFRIRPTAYSLLSVADPQQTIDTCRRALEEMGVSVALAHAPPEESVLAGAYTLSLKCWYDEKWDARGVLASLKSARFRVEVHRPTAIQQTAGYAVLLSMVLEKGSANSLKLVYQHLRRYWSLDMAHAPSPLASRTSTVDDEDRFVEVVYAR